LPVLLALLLGACNGGDFWRTLEDFRNDDLHACIGREATSSVGARRKLAEANGRIAISPIR
jgi:hypothetical protein